MFEYSLNILSKIKNSKNINSSNFNNSILTRTFEILKYCKQFDFKKIKYLNIFNLALFDKKKKNFDMAIKNLEKIIKESNEQDINLKALITLSSIYIEIDELKKAKTILNSIKKNNNLLKHIDKNDFFINKYYLSFAQIHYKKKQYYLCRKYYKKILENETNINYKPKLFIIIANTYLKENKLKSYRRYLSKALDIYLNTNKVRLSLNLLELIIKANIELADLKKAKEAIKTAMDLDIKTNFRYTNLNIYKEDTKLNINDKFENISFFKLIINMKFFREKNLNILKNIFDFIINFYKKNKKNNLMKLSSLIQKLIFQNKNVLLKSILKEKFSEIIIHLINLNKIEFKL